MNRKKTVCYNLKACWHTISRMYNTLGLDHDVSISTGYVLLNLSKDKGIPSTSIAPQLGMEANSLTRLLKSIEKQGLIRKETDKKDKRQVNIFLTSLGQKKRSITSKTVREFNEILESKINMDELEVFKSVLQKITDITEQNFKTV